MRAVLLGVLTLGIAQFLTNTAHTIWLYALVTLPGTFFHELAHYIAAYLLNGNPSGFNLIPSGYTLGSVRFHPNWYNAATVALAPFLLAPFALTLVVFASRASLMTALLLCYLAACAWCACIPSPQDFSIAIVPSSWPLAGLVFGAVTLVYTFLWKTSQTLLR